MYGHGEIQCSPESHRRRLSLNGTSAFWITAPSTDSSKRRWSWQTKGPILGPPQVSGELIFVGSDDGYLYAFDAFSGDLRWKERSGSAVRCGPATAGGNVYVMSTEPRMYAITADNDGRQQWKSAQFDFLAQTVLAVSDGIVYASADNTLYAVDAESGHLLWTPKIAIRGNLSSPAVAGGVVVVTSEDGFLYAFDAKTGDSRWQQSGALGQFTSPGGYFAPGVGEGIICIGSDVPGLIAFDAITGQNRWHTPLDSQYSPLQLWLAGRYTPKTGASMHSTQ